jgi:GR25 family glycosyltransferase involved in LPS biosynthesis
MTSLFKNVGFTDYEFVEAVDGKQLKPTTELKDLFEGNDFGSNVGFIGCALSHYNLWKALLASNDEYYVIFEDDVALVPKFIEKFETLKKGDAFKKCNYLLLGYSMFSLNRENTKDVYVKENSVLSVEPLQSDLYVGGTFAYSINRNGAQILVDYIAKNGIKHGIDYVVKICPELKPMELRPQIVFTDWYERINQAVDTDIQKETAKLNFNNILEEFTFIQGVDQIGNDSFFKRGTIEEFKAAAMADPNCAGFNTLGFFKTRIDKNSLQSSQYFKEKDGIYIKNSFKKSPRLKLLSNWESSEKMAEGFGSMGTDLDLTWKDEADYYIIVNMPGFEDFYEPKKSIVFQMEPWVYDDKKRWGVKTWGPWANPDPSKFLHVHNRRFLNPAQWSLKGDLVNLPPKQNDTCIILSHKKHDTGHMFRINVVSGGKIDVYGKENYHSLDQYRGQVPDDNRYNVYSKYRYVLAVENNSEINYATEKIWEPLICECLPFYWGCPNLEEHIDPQAFVRLPDDPLKAAEIIQQAVEEDWWSQRIDKIREAKKKVMTELGFFPVISRIIS